MSGKTDREKKHERVRRVHGIMSGLAMVVEETAKEPAPEMPARIAESMKAALLALRQVCGACADWEKVATAKMYAESGSTWNPLGMTYPELLAAGYEDVD